MAAFLGFGATDKLYLRALEDSKLPCDQAHFEHLVVARGPSLERLHVSRHLRLEAKLLSSHGSMLLVL